MYYGTTSVLSVTRTRMVGGVGGIVRGKGGKGKRVGREGEIEFRLSQQLSKTKLVFESGKIQYLLFN